MNSSQTNLKDDENYCDFCRAITDVRTNFKEGNRVCQSCGLVVQQRLIDPTAEYRIFADENGGSKTDPCRVGFPFDFRQADGGLDLRIEGGKKMQASDEFHRKMRMIENKDLIQSAAYYRGFKLIKLWAEDLFLPPHVANKAEDLYHTLKLNRKTLRGLSVEKISAALLWLACQELGQAIDFGSLADTTAIEFSEIKRTRHLIMKTKGEPEVVNSPTVTEMVPDVICKPTAKVLYGVSIARMLNLSDETCALVEILEKNIDERGTLDGKKPKNITGISAYIICSLSSNPLEVRSWKEIASAVEIAEATLKKNYKLLIPDLEKVIPSWEGMRPLSALKGR